MVMLQRAGDAAADEAPTPARPLAARRQLRGWPVALALLFALLATAMRPSGEAPVRAQAANTHVDTVRAEYQIILNSYVQPLTPGPLLSAAWRGATQYLQSKGVSFTTSAPNASGDKDQAFGSFSTAWNSLAREVGGSVDLTQLAFAADDAMAFSLNDDHTFFLTPEEYIQDQQELGGSDATKFGIGVQVDDYPPHVVREVAPGGPADQAGIHAGDTITAINGVSVEAMGRADFDALVDGPDGTPVTASVSRPGQGQLDFSFTMGPYLFPIFSYRVLDGGVGYMRLRSFVNPWTPLQDGKTVVQELDDALNSFEAAGVTEWLLDLRGNHGGFIATAQAFAGRFLTDAITDVDIDERGHESQSMADGHTFPVQRPLAVLINRFSASSSEVLSSALKEYGRATLVGTRTAGALGSSLNFPLPDAAALSITISRVVSGRNQETIDRIGVFQDVTAPEPSPQQLAEDTDPVINAAENALAAQEPFSVAPTSEATLPQDQLQALLAPYELTAEEVPTAPEIRTVNFLGNYTLDRYEQWNNFEGPGRDAFASRALAQQRGWQGAEIQFFGETTLGASEQTVVDLYSSADGAAAYLGSNDFPDLLQKTDAPIQLGDQTVAWRGQWGDVGSLALSWRHGRIVFTVSLATVPGEETFDPVITLAKAVEARYQAAPFAQ
ncbi:MAG TPA: S41 family peptidase [Dehalococcoidia bacterium]|nr:S41 family peptidase [Dehalococcoidia bacterium]